VYIARFALVIDLFFTFLVVIVPAREIVENSILGHDDPEQPVVWKKFVWRMLIRTLMVMVAAALGIFVGHFDVRSLHSPLTASKLTELTVGYDGVG